MRVTVDIPENDLMRLDTLAAARRVSRAALIREAVGLYLTRQTSDPLQAGFGLWKDRNEDGLAYQKRMREER